METTIIAYIIFAENCNRRAKIGLNDEWEYLGVEAQVEIWQKVALEWVILD